MLKFQQNQALTSHFESFWSIVTLVMGRDQNLRESSVNVISRFTICGHREIRE